MDTGRVGLEHFTDSFAKAHQGFSWAFSQRCFGRNLSQVEMKRYLRIAPDYYGIVDATVDYFRWAMTLPSGVIQSIDFFDGHAGQEAIPRCGN